MQFDRARIKENALNSGAMDTRLAKASVTRALAKFWKFATPPE